MSFFDDEDDEPPPNPRQATSRPRPSARRRPTGAANHQQVQTRRIVAGVVLVVFILVIVLLVHGCDVSANKSSLQSYAGNVYSIVGNSDKVGQELFSDLDGGQSESALQIDLADAHVEAGKQLQQVENLSVPGSMTRAQTYVVLALRQRYDGIGIIADNIQTALGSSAAADGVRKIAQGTAYLYSSDVVYKGYAAPAIASALRGASLTPSSSNINPGQFVSDLGWLQQKFIATKIGARLPSKDVNTVVKGGLYGHQLTSVSVGGTTLIVGGSNTVAASPAPTFTLSLTNGGNYNEYDVGCKVTIKGLDDTGTTTIPETTPGESTTCSVQLPKPPTAGTYQVTAEVEKVPGEANLTNNSQTYAVDFTG